MFPSYQVPFDLFSNASQPRFPSSSTIIVHGQEATGKSLTLEKILESIDTSSAIVRSRGCITSRHLLERIISASIEALAASSHGDVLNDLDGRCESVSAFVIQLQRICEGRGKFILVFDRIDQQREALPTLISALARLGEVVCQLISFTRIELSCHRFPVSLLFSWFIPPACADSILAVSRIFISLLIVVLSLCISSHPRHYRCTIPQ